MDSTVMEKRRLCENSSHRRPREEEVVWWWPKPKPGLLNGKFVLFWILVFTLACFILTMYYMPNKHGPKSSSKTIVSSSDGNSVGDADLNETELELLFTNYTSTFHKNYSDQEQKSQRIGFFKKSLERIKKLNSKKAKLQSSSSGANEDQTDQVQVAESGQPDEDDKDNQNFVTWSEGMPKNKGVASWGLTAFADLSPDEFKSRYLNPSLAERIQKRHELHSHHRHHFKHKSHSDSEELEPVEAVEGESETNSLDLDSFKNHHHQVHGPGHRHKRSASTLPDKVDWRDKQIVSSVKHQKDCGACWAFSTVETVESMQAMNTGKLEELSVQQVIDCSKNGNSGCSGGDTCTAVAWMSSRKLSPEAKYPLTLKDGSCKLQSSADGVQVASNYSCSRLIDDEDRMIELLATHGPVAVAVDATNWQYYVGGVIQWNCDATVNHAVQIVGYDRTAKPHHYIVRNSWGPTFGDKGYLYIATNKNLCGIATEVVWLSVQ